MRNIIYLYYAPQYYALTMYYLTLAQATRVIFETNNKSALFWVGFSLCGVLNNILCISIVKWNIRFLTFLLVITNITKKTENEIRYSN